MRQPLHQEPHFLTDNNGMDEMQELVRRFREENDEEAFKQLLSLTRRMIYKIIYSHNLNIGDYKIDENDLYQEGCLALYNAIFTYDMNQNAKFTTYAYLKIRSRIKDVIRDYITKQGEGNYSLENSRPGTVPNMVAQPEAYYRDDNWEEKIGRFMMELKPLDKRILQLRRRGYTYEEIAGDLGVNRKLVDNHLMMMKRKMRKQFNRENEDEHS